MDIYSAYSAVNKSVLDVVRSLNILEPVKEEAPADMLRVEESPLMLTQDIMAAGRVVTAHNITQYKNDFHRLVLEEDVTTVLDSLLAIDKQMEDVC